MPLFEARSAGVLFGAGLVLAACTGPVPAAAPAPSPAPVAPVAPPAACVLDVAALAAATGLTWTVDEATAGDRRCVYDTEPAGTAFLVVDLAGAADLETVAAVCAPGSRAPAGVDGFVCRLPGGGVYAARVRADALLTAAAAEIPAGTTAERVATALQTQLSP